MDNDFADLLAPWVIGATGLSRAFSSTLGDRLSDGSGLEPIYAIGSGIGYGAHGSVQAATTADLFPARQLGTILGPLELGWCMGGFGGAWLGSYWYDHYGGYQAPSH